MTLLAHVQIPCLHADGCGDGEGSALQSGDIHVMDLKSPNIERLGLK